MCWLVDVGLETACGQVIGGYNTMLLAPSIEDVTCAECIEANKKVEQEICNLMWEGHG